MGPKYLCSPAHWAQRYIPLYTHTQFAGDVEQSKQFILSSSFDSSIKSWHNILSKGGSDLEIISLFFLL